KAGAALPDRASGDRHLVEPQQAAGQGRSERSHQLHLRQHVMALLEAYTAPKKKIPRRAYLTVSTLAGLLALTFWCALSYSGVVRSDFLPTPMQVVWAGIAGARDGSLALNTGVSVGEIMSGFILASLLAVPLGILMGTFAIVEAAIEPIANFMRYLPVSALIP